MLPPISHFEVEKALIDTKRDSSSELYVPLAMFKKCSDIVSFQLALLFTLVLSYCSLPQVFKNTCITPIYKGKGKRTCPSSYRPISCLNIYCKIFERILYQRLLVRIESKLQSTCFQNEQVL